MHLLVFVVLQIYIWPLGKNKTLFSDRATKSKGVCVGGGCSVKRSDLEDGGYKQPVPLQVLLVV